MQHRTRWAAIAVVGGVLLASGCDSSPNGPNEPPGPIAYLCACPSGLGLYRVNLDGTGAVRLVAGERLWSPAWSPDGAKIAYAADVPTTAEEVHQIYVINADGTGKHAITSFDDGASDPVWSPDGSRILFFRSIRGLNADYGIYVMNADGSGVQRLTPADNSIYGGMSWSPDGSTIVVSKLADDETGRYDLHLMNSDGSNPRALTTETAHRGYFNPRWSPQGDLIAFQVWPEGDGGIRLATIKPDGSDLTYLTALGNDAIYPNWSPDGAELIFTSYPQFQAEQSRLYIINRDGTNKRRVTTGSSEEVYPTWAPATASTHIGV